MLWSLILLACAALAYPASTLAGEPETAVALNDEGIRHFDAGEFAQALACFQRAVQLDGRAPEIRTNLGKTYAAIAVLLLKEHAENGGGPRVVTRALEHLQQALLNWQGDADTHLALGFCRMVLGDFDGARKALEESLVHDPQSLRAARLLGVTLERLGRLQEAEAAFKKVLLKVGDDPDLVRRLRRIRFDREAIEGYRVLSGEHFRIHYPAQIAQPEVELILRELENFTKELERRWAISAPATVTVICYPPGEFAERTGLHDVVGGAFDGKIRIPFPKELEQGGLGTRQVARHECIHMMLRAVGDAPPRWLDEGMAQLFDGQDRAAWADRWREVLVGEPEVGIELREARYREEDPATWGALYLHSFFLLQHIRNLGSEFRIDMLVREAGRGNGWEQAFLSVYGAGVNGLDRKWRTDSVANAKGPKER